MHFCSDNVDGDSSVIPSLPAFCYLNESAVTELGELTIPRIRVTKSAIDGLPARSKDTVYWDIGLPGFGVKVTPRGRKVFVVMYRLASAGSRLRKYTIGPYGRVTLPMARAQAQKIFAASAYPKPAAGIEYQTCFGAMWFLIGAPKASTKSRRGT